MNGLPVFMESFIISVILAQCTSPGRAATRSRKILTSQMDQAAINRRGAVAHCRQEDLCPVHSKIRSTVLGEVTDLLEAIAINQLFDAFPGRELTCRVLFPWMRLSHTAPL